MTQSTFPPAGVQQPYGQPYGPPPGFGGPGAPYGQPGPGFGYQQPPKKKTGLIVGSIVGVLILIGGLVVGALLLFGTRTIDQADAQEQVTGLAEQLTGVAPEELSCPADVEVQAGSSFTCTGTVEGQDVSFTVGQTDDEGHVEVTADNTYLPLSAVEEDLSSQIEAAADVVVDADTSCDADGRTVLVDAAGEQLGCTISNAEDPSQSIEILVTVHEDGTATIESSEDD